MLRDINQVAFWCSAAVATASVILYAFLPWRSTVGGRHLMVYMFILALMFDVLALMTRLHSMSLAWVWTIIFASYPVVLTWRFTMIFRALQGQLKESHGREEEAEAGFGQEMLESRAQPGQEGREEPEGSGSVHR